MQYLGMLLLAAILLWLSLRTIPDVEGESKMDFIWKTWEKSNKGYLFAMAGVAMLSHVVRAHRWKMLLATTGHSVNLINSLLSLLIGYLVNLAVPRGGEISRCYNLMKLEKTPIEISFGTVVAERIVDVLCLIALILIAFFVEWDKLVGFISSLPVGGEGMNITKIVVIGLIVLSIGAAGFYFFRKSEKIKKILDGFKSGLLSVFQQPRPGLFVIWSLLIWLLYFVMSYLVLVAFPETESLGWGAVLTLFALGAIAMAAPLPGGAGSYHTLVPLGLVTLYGMPKGDAIAFVFIFHAWQTFIMIVAGVVSLVITYWKLR